jgi:hypothetical protein
MGGGSSSACGGNAAALHFIRLDDAFWYFPMRDFCHSAGLFFAPGVFSAAKYTIRCLVPGRSVTKPFAGHGQQYAEGLRMLAQSLTEKFRASVRCFCPGEQGYDEARKIHNAMIDRHSAARRDCARAMGKCSGYFKATAQSDPVGDVATGRRNQRDHDAGAKALPFLLQMATERDRPTRKNTDPHPIEGSSPSLICRRWPPGVPYKPKADSNHSN